MNFDRKKRLPLLISLALVLITLATYWRLLSSDFVNYDDNKYVTENHHVQAGLTFPGLRWAFDIGYASNWHPLTWLSHMLDCQLFGLDPRGHHLTNLLFHLANTLLLFGVLKRMTGALWPSAMVAALFALHPAHVESVAWVAERKDVLSTFFFLLTLGTYAIYGQQSKIRSARSKLAYALALICFALGLMSKPMLASVPFVLLLLDYWPLRRAELSAERLRIKPIMPLVLEKIPFFALAACSSVITVLAQKRGGAVVPIEVISLDVRCWNALVSYLRYIGKLFWPHDLAVIYPYVYEWPSWLVGAAAALVLTVSWLALRLRRPSPYFPVGWFWFLGTLVPVIGLVQVGEQAMADRYTYIPSIGLFIVISWGAVQVLGNWPLRKRALITTAAVTLSVCVGLTRSQVACWQDGISLFEHAVAVTRNNATAHNSLGIALAAKNRLAEAVAQYRLALQINPSYGLAHNNLGVALTRLGRHDEAVAHYQSALDVDPEDFDAHFNLANSFNPGFVDEAAGDLNSRTRWANPEQSREHYLKALALGPDDISARVNLGNLEAAEGNLNAAVRYYQDALQVDPRAALAHFNLALALARIGKTNDAVQSFSKAVELQPDNPEAQFQLANILASQGQLEEAIVHYRIVLKLRPTHFMASCNLGGALAKLNRFQEASRYFAEAIRVRPDYPDAHVHLGKVFALQGKLEEAVKEYATAARLEPNNPDLHRQTALLLVQQGRTEGAASCFSAVVKLKPEDPRAHYDLALVYVKLGQSDQAVAQFQKALRLKPDWVEAMNNLAWLLATAPESDVRNGTQAVALAGRACELTQHQDPNTLGTLAAAYAEDGDFEKAVATAMRAHQLAKETGRLETAKAVLVRLESYREKKAWHQPPTPDQNQKDRPILR